MGVPDNRSFVASIAARYGRRLRRFLSVRLRNTADVPDLAQEVFLRLLRVEGCENIRSPEAYLFTIASHEDIKRLMESLQRLRGPSVRMTLHRRIDEGDMWPAEDDPGRPTGRADHHGDRELWRRRRNPEMPRLRLSRIRPDHGIAVCDAGEVENIDGMPRRLQGRRHFQDPEAHEHPFIEQEPGRGDDQTNRCHLASLVLCTRRNQSMLTFFWLALNADSERIATSVSG